MAMNQTMGLTDLKEAVKMIKGGNRGFFVKDHTCTKQRPYFRVATCM